RHRVGRNSRPRFGRSPLNLGEQRLYVSGLLMGVEEAAIEIAVVADGGAERDVYVEAQHLNCPRPPPAISGLPGCRARPVRAFARGPGAPTAPTAVFACAYATT